jgi:adenine/guanine phosphoribosyltransferase-like PRPP-binding protein
MNLLQQELDEYRRTPDGRIIQGCSHTSRILSHKYRNKIIMSTYKYLKELDIEYDAIACCGTSGLMVVPQLAELLNKNIIIVRKKCDSGYSDFIIEGTNTHNYIIIDDLICSGSTVEHIIKNINEDSYFAKCIGVYSYMKDQCSYKKIPEYCEKDLGIPYL